MLDIRFRGRPHILTGPARPPGAVNANIGLPPAAEGGVPDFPVSGVLWAPPPVWEPMRPSSCRSHLTVVK
jgi:hypothetical protein